MTTRERRPSHGAPSTGTASRQAAAKPLDCPQSSWPRQWAQIRERRRAARELDRLLGTPSRPNVAEVYGLRGGDDGFC